MRSSEMRKGQIGYIYQPDLDDPPTVDDRLYIIAIKDFANDHEETFFSAEDNSPVSAEDIDADNVVICHANELIYHTTQDIKKLVRDRYKRYQYVVYDAQTFKFDVIGFYIHNVNIYANGSHFESINCEDVVEHIKNNKNDRYKFIYFDNSELIEHAKKPQKVNAMFTSPIQPVSGQDPFINSNDIIRQVDRCVYDFTTGRLGVKKSNASGFSVFVKAKDNKRPSITSCEIKDFSRPIPAVAIRTKIDKINVGDVVIIKDNNGQENWLYFLGVEKDGDTTNIEISGIETDTGKKVSVAVQDGVLFDGKSILSVKNYFGEGTMKDMLIPMMLMQQSGQQMNPLMLLMMTGGLDSIDKSLLPFLLMGQQGGTMNPMLMMLMMNGTEGFSGDMKSMLPFMMMGGGMDQNALMMMLLLSNKEEKVEKK